MPDLIRYRHDGKHRHSGLRAGIHAGVRCQWIPACAGMTSVAPPRPSLAHLPSLATPVLYDGIELKNLPLLCHRSAYGVIAITGERVDDYLQGQITQDLRRLTSDRLLYAALLTPQGKAVCDLWLAADGARRLLIVPACALEAACARLRRFSLGYTLTIAADPELTLWSLQGAGSRRMAQALPLAWPLEESDDDGCWLLAKAQPAIDATVVDEAVIEAARIAYGTPRFGIDWCDFPLNANLIERDGISFDKGCFVGQEVASRMRWRGGIRKTLCHCRLAHLPDRLPANICTTAPVGKLTSAALDGDGTPYGIGQLPIETVKANSRLTLEDGSAVTLLPHKGETS